MESRWASRICLAVLLIAAAALRLWGIRWGLPNALHSYSYHPDEFLIIGAAGSVVSIGFPRFYNYPSLFIYVVAAAVMAASAYGAAQTVADAYLVARIASALMGIAAVAATYWAGKSLWGRREGMIAAAVLCIAPIHVQHSHFGTVDVPSTVFVAACLGYAGLVLGRGTWRDYILCGLMAGLAAGTKYNAGLVAFALIAAHSLGDRERGAGLRRLIAGLGSMVAACLISTPGAIVQSGNFLYGLTYEMRHSASGHGLVFAATGNGFVYTFASSLWYGLGPALAILFLAAALYGAWRRDRRALVILAFVIPYYALISISQVRFARYAMPMLPAAALLVAWMACDLHSRLSKPWRLAWTSVIGPAILGTLLFTIALDGLFIQPPPQDRAIGWISSHIAKGSEIVTFDVPWFYSPPYSKNTGLGSLSERERAMADSPYALHPLSTSRRTLSRWVAVSDYEVLDALRAHRSGIRTSNVAAIVDSLDVVKKNYTKRATFADSLSALGITFGSTQSLPHDMRYPAPTIWIYELRKP